MRQRKMSLYPVITTEFVNLAELAQVMQTSTKTASRVLNGKRPFNRHEKERICAFLGLTREEVFGNV